MEAEFRPGADFKAVAARLKGAPPEVRKELNAGIRAGTKPLETAVKQSVKGLQSRGARGGGGAARGAHNASRSKSGKTGRTGLRETVARAVQTKITYSGRRTGVRVRVDGTKLPENARKLPRAMNKGQVRHPVFGNKNRWSTQMFSPPGWFDDPIKKLSPKVVSEIQQAVRRAMEKLQ